MVLLSLLFIKIFISHLPLEFHSMQFYVPDPLIFFRRDKDPGGQLQALSNSRMHHVFSHGELPVRMREDHQHENWEEWGNL